MTLTTSAHRRRLASLAVVPLLLVPASCGLLKHDDPVPTPDITAPPAEPTKSAKPLPTPPKLEKSQGIVKDVQITQCPTTAGAVEAKGTAKNSAKQTRDLVVIVVWLKNDSGDPLGSGMAVLKDVKAGKSKEWTVKADVVAPADRCVLNATAGQVKEKKK